MVAWPEEAFRRLGGIDRATSIVVLTHDPKLDDAALTVALNPPFESTVAVPVPGPVSVTARGPVLVPATFSG